MPTITISDSDTVLEGVPHDEPLLQQLTAKYSQRSRLEKIRAEVDEYRTNLKLCALRGFDGDVENGTTIRERARRIVEFAAQQLNGEWKPDWSTSNIKYVVRYKAGEWDLEWFDPTQIPGAIYLRDPADLPLLIELCGDELNMLKG